MLRNLQLEKNNLDLYQQCFKNNDDPKDYNHLVWQFFENSLKNYVQLKYDEDKKTVAGIYASRSSNFIIEQKNYIGAQSLDTITDINYRGQGIFVNLAKEVYNELTQNNFKLVYGFPNGNSIYGFKKRLDWQILDPVPFLIKPLKTKYFTKKIKFLKWLPGIRIPLLYNRNQKNYQITKDNKFPDDVNEIWQKFSKNINIALDRSQDYLNWRYIEKPNSDYQILHCTNKDGQYLGYVVYTVLRKHGGKIGYIMELIYDIKTPKAGTSLLRQAILDIKKQDADLVLAWSFNHAPNYNIFKKEFFIKIPDKLKPIELHFGAVSFDQLLDNTIYNRNNWYISYSDSDTV